MKAITQTACISAILLSLANIGCQGSSPMKRETNPVKGYSVAQQPGVKYQTGVKPPQTVDPDNSQYVCFEPLKVSVKGDRGERLLEFVEDQEATYEITVVSLLDDANFEIKASGPAGIQLIRLSKKDNVAIYKLGWRPGKVKSAKGVDNATLSLSYLSPIANKRCGSDIRVGLNLQVVKTQGAPSIVFESLPQSAINIGDHFDFAMIIDDPASLPNLGPDLQKISFPASLSSGEKMFLNAVPAISCEATGKQIETTRFKFNCKFDSKKIEVAPSDTDQSLEAKFVASAVSKRGGQSSGPVTGSVMIKVPKKETVPSAKAENQFSPPAEDDKIEASSTEQARNPEKPAAPKKSATQKNTKKSPVKKGAKS